MKLLVFAHTPPPHHGQSYMVQLMLEGLGGDRRTAPHGGAGATPHKPSGASAAPQLAPAGKKPAATGAAPGIECYHVNARVSNSLEDVGGFRVGKLFRLVGYCAEAVWCRFRYGVENFYYVPAPGKRSALYRDWVVLFLCRPFFKRLVLHWHASGLARWLDASVSPRGRALTRFVARRADLSIVLSNYGRPDAEAFAPKRIEVVGNGIVDPCPDFSARVLPRRQARLEYRRWLTDHRSVPPGLAAAAGPEPQVFKALFLGHCTREKGLFEAVQGTLLARRTLAERGSPVELRLVVAGQFVTSEEEAEFQRLCREAGGNAITHVGFVSGEAKQRCFEEADGFCFPSHIESFGLVLVEAMAYGLPIVATRCGAMPEVLPPGYPGLVAVRDAGQVATGLVELITSDCFERLRDRFETSFTLAKHLQNLAAALRSVAPQS